MIYGCTIGQRRRRTSGRSEVSRIALSKDLPAEDFAEVDSFIEHGEPAEGVCSLAWALHNAHVAVPGWVNNAIRDLTDGLVDPAHMPPRLPEIAD
jgi:hypothetical protein